MLLLGIFGGTFDPPHSGHLILAAEAHAQLGLDKVLWVLTPQPPHKEGQVITPLKHRLNMVKLALRGNRDFQLSRVEIDRPGPHYAVDTVLALQAQNPGAELVYIMGGDSLHDLPMWRDPQGLVAACSKLGVMRRPGDSINLPMLERTLPGITQKVRFILAPLVEISSSDIRKRVEEGRTFQYYVPRAVYETILKNKLYRSG